MLLASPKSYFFAGVPFSSLLEGPSHSSLKRQNQLKICYLSTCPTPSAGPTNLLPAKISSEAHHGVSQDYQETAGITGHSDTPKYIQPPTWAMPLCCGSPVWATKHLNPPVLTCCCSPCPWASKIWELPSWKPTTCQIRPIVSLITRPHKGQCLHNAEASIHGEGKRA